MANSSKAVEVNSLINQVLEAPKMSEAALNRLALTLFASEFKRVRDADAWAKFKAKITTPAFVLTAALTTVSLQGNAAELTPKEAADKLKEQGLAVYHKPPELKKLEAAKQAQAQAQQQKR